MNPQDQPILYATLVFFAMTALDFVFAEYTKAAGDRRSTAAANWSACIIPFNCIVIMGYIEVWWMIFPTIAGAWLGTKLAVLYGDAVHEWLHAAWQTVKLLVWASLGRK
jgi:hypothetical protein